MESSKPINTLVIDAGPIIRNEPAVSSLIASANEIVTLPSVVNEIRDEAARSRLDVTLRPFLTLRDPKPQSLQFVQTFARKTGDLSVLSNVDQRLIALAYELELERNGGDWRLRNVPGQKTLNGPVPSKASATPSSVAAVEEAPTEQPEQTPPSEDAANETPTDALEIDPAQSATEAPDQISHGLDTLTIQHDANADADAGGDSSSDSDSDASNPWITPRNLSAHQAADAGTAVSHAASGPQVMQVATLTTDFAMQNVLLQTNLNLVSGSGLQRVRTLKRHMQRCHACFLLVRDGGDGGRRAFCPRCGRDTLTKVACSTDASGAFTVHLKRNMQWNNRGNRYSVPKPTGGSASGKRLDGGGKGGWGHSLVLAEDQKEYVRAVAAQKRSKDRDLMDRDVLPDILTGQRAAGGARLKVGAGRDVNARKRR